MKISKSGLLKSLLKNINKAFFVERYKYYDIDALIQLENTDDFSRRKFLIDVTKTCGALGISTILPFSACTTNTSNKDKTQEKGETKPFQKIQPKITIIGAGIAGLHAAYILKKSGFIAEVYEGDARIGGRIYTKSDIFGKGLTTEFGGEFIDTNHMDMHNLAKEFNLELLDTQKDIIQNKTIKDAYFFNNRHYTEKEVINEFRKIIKKLENDKKKCGDDYDTPYAIKLDKMPLEQYVQNLKCSEWLKELIIYAYVAEYGLDAGEQSSLNFLDMIDTNTNDGFKIFGDSDERFKIKGGNQKIIEALQNKLQNQIYINYKLSSIKTNSTQTVLTFENGKSIDTDFVIITIPFTKLRLVDIHIPAMTKDKINTINELGYGQNNKLLLGFNNRIWREAKPHYSGYLFHPDIHNGWDNTHMQYENKGVGGYTVFIGGKPSIQLAEGAKANNMRDTVPNEFVKLYLKKLNGAFPNALSHFNNIHKAALWSNNPFINASYSCYKIGQWTSIAGKEFEPVGSIYFAGEHCSEDFQGYMNGGAETGRRAAENILAVITK